MPQSLIIDLSYAEMGRTRIPKFYQGSCGMVHALAEKLKSVIDDCWAKYKAFRVIFVISFLMFMVVSASYLFYTLYQLTPLFPLVFILVVLGLRRGIFTRIANSLKRRQNNS